MLVHTLLPVKSAIARRVSSIAHPIIKGEFSYLADMATLWSAKTLLKHELQGSGVSALEGLAWDAPLYVSALTLNLFSTTSRRQAPVLPQQFSHTIARSARPGSRLDNHLKPRGCPQVTSPPCTPSRFSPS